MADGRENGQGRTPYRSLPPDIWAECLHYLLPEELSKASQLLPHTNVAVEGDSAEKAAWMAVRSMAGIARTHWENLAIASNGVGATLDEQHGESIDEKAIAVQSVVQQDKGPIGNVLRVGRSTSIGGGDNPNLDKRNDNERSASTTTKQQQLVRFQDETWQGLYGLLYGILSEVVATETAGEPSDRVPESEQSDLNVDESDARDEDANAPLVGVEEQGADEVDATDNKAYDPEYIALAIGLLFDAPSMPPLLMTLQRREKLEKLAVATFERSSNARTKSVPSDTRSCLLSLRLGNAGLWDVAADILSLSSSLDDGEYSETNERTDEQRVLAIDRAIYSSKFLIDRLYSQTYVRPGMDVPELRSAIECARKAVKSAGPRYQIFLTMQMRSTTFVEDKGWWIEENDETNQQRKRPPPPIRSLFANDALRYIHAKLALTRALTLTGQHLGLRACTIGDLEVFPLEFTEEDLLLAASGEPSSTFKASLLFFKESMDQCLGLDVLFQNQWLVMEETEEALVAIAKKKGVARTAMPSVYRSTRHRTIPLLGAKMAAVGELNYCMSSVFSRIGSERGNELGLISIAHLSEAFRVVMNEALQSGGSGGRGPRCVLDETTLEVLVYCAKDLGKACGFLQRFDADLSELDSLVAGDPSLVLDFAYVFSIYLHGSSSHPTVENIGRLCEGYRAESGRSPPSGASLRDSYHRVAKWIVEEFVSSPPTPN
ncbi:unnamed protein product [Pseudo-nitzschia multistriata]|uniref:Uncharacterized protein n=1 Tax=Pseudo-nitzschia multistriata TaxID=183589 RepID=A0A448YWY4_9STRA|nr:unnamed protein product [Pseudo-nitzschia multistriata]